MSMCPSLVNKTQRPVRGGSSERGRNNHQGNRSTVSPGVLGSTEKGAGPPALWSFLDSANSS